MKKITLLTLVLVGLSVSQFGQAADLILARQDPSPASDMMEPYIACALDQMNQPFQIKIVPWKRAQIGTKEQVYHGFYSATQTAQRNQYATLAQDLISNDWLMVQKEHKSRLVDERDFWAQRFTANLGTAKLKWLNQQKSNGKLNGVIIETNSVYQSWLSFMNNRSDVLLENQVNFSGLIQRHRQGSTTGLTRHVIRKVQQSIYFSNQYLSENPGFLDRFNQELNNCAQQTDNPLILAHP